MLNRIWTAFILVGFVAAVVQLPQAEYERCREAWGLPVFAPQNFCALLAEPGDKPSR